MIERKSVYPIQLNSITNKKIELSSYMGKKILIVNVASECMYTPQYAEMQELHERHGDKIAVIAVPCNQFGNQEPGDPDDIKNFCIRNYGVTFPISEKIDIKGQNQHKLYAWLTESALNGVRTSSVEWNFQKYLLSESGSLLKYFPSSVSPLDNAITKHLK